MLRFPRLLFVVATILWGGSHLYGQGLGADGKPIFPPNLEDRPKGLQEGIEKMRIAKEKKEHDEMVSRGEEAVKITSEVQQSFVRTGSLTSDDLAKVAKVEKLVKKIRDELGGDGDDNSGDGSESAEEPAVPNSTSGAVDALKDKTDSLFGQLKQTTRFTISAAAILSSNAVLKIARFLKLRK